MVARAIHAGDPILAELDPIEGAHRCDLAPRPAPIRRAWWRNAPVVWRPFRDVRQLHPSVWVADDLDCIVLTAAEAMAVRDPVELPGSDGRLRRFKRCTSDVWRALRSSRGQTPALEHLRETLAGVHGLQAVARLSAEAA